MVFDPNSTCSGLEMAGLGKLGNFGSLLVDCIDLDNFGGLTSVFALV